MVILIAGMPASGKDTLANIISERTGMRAISMSKDILIPLVQDDSFRKKISEDVDMSSINFRDYPLTRHGLIRLADDLNGAIKKPYFHFSDLAYRVYGTSIVIPSFRQKSMLSYLVASNIPHRKIFIACSENIRYERWMRRDNISVEEMKMQDDIEYLKYIKPLLDEVDFDYFVDNSGPVSCLEDFVGRCIKGGLQKT